MSAQTAKVTKESSRLTLDQLAASSSETLAQLYSQGSVPASLKVLDGAPKGRMLAVRLIEKSPLADPIQRFAASAFFVWDGKSFQSKGAKTGTGINRVSVPGILGSQNLFPFDTLIGASAVDGNPTVILDYDKPANPPYIRKIHDEIREVSPGLYLGPAMWKADTGPVHVLWFALDTHVQTV